MRKCIRCGAEMKEGLELKTTMHCEAIRVVRSGTTGTLSKNFLGEVRAAVCPACGQLELYVEDPERVRQYEEKS